MKSKFILFCVLLAVFTLSAAAQSERQLLPVDEAAKDVSFKQFRDKLISAVRRRDAKYVLSVVDPNIKNGFGGEDGIANFKKKWKIAALKSDLWNELQFILTHGGAFQTEGKNKTFFAPYIYSNFPEDLDAFKYNAISDKNIKLLATPFLTAPTVAALSYNFVEVDFQHSLKDKTNNEKYSWLKVETLGGKKGFVPARFVRSPIGYRAGFEKKKGLWKMVFLVAGD